MLKNHNDNDLTRQIDRVAHRIVKNRSTIDNPKTPNEKKRRLEKDILEDARLLEELREKRRSKGPE